MKIGLITAYPPSKVTLNEYGYYLTKYFVKNPQVERLVLLSDVTQEPKLLDYEHADKIDVVECWEFNSYKSVWNILKAVKKHKPDIVIINAHFLKFGDKKIPAALGLMLSFFLKSINVPSIFLIHNIMEKVDLTKAGFTESKALKTIYNTLGNILTRFILMADIVAVTIDKYVDILEKKYHAKNVALKPHGAFDLPPTPTFELPKGPLKVMAFGKFGTYKKVDDMIEAVEMIRKRNPSLDIEIVIAGMDSPNSIGYLDQMAKKYAHVPQLTFTGYIHENDVEKIFKDSAVVVFPYTSTTGSSGVLHQAGGFGNAVVLPHIDDLAHLIEEEGYEGVYFEPNDVESLSHAIEKILVNPDLRKSMGLNNYNVATSLPMDDVIYWYMAHCKEILNSFNIPKDSSQMNVKLPEIYMVNDYRNFSQNLEDLDSSFTINTDENKALDLAGFNSLVHLAMKAEENHHLVNFEGNRSSDLDKFIHLSKLNHLFIKK